MQAEQGLGATCLHVDPEQLMRRLRLRLVVPMLVLLFLSTIDRANVSFAALQMNEALGFSPADYGFGVSLFFVGYILIQLPSLWLLQRIGMRRWLFLIALVWGIAATSMAFVHTREMFFALRVVLGIAEGGYAPGLMLYLAQWIPKSHRAGAISNVMLAVPISVVVGGPLSGWLMSIENPLEMAGWRWMFLIEGMPTIMLAFAVLWLFSDRPRDARWLAPHEREWIEQQVAADHAAPQSHSSAWTLAGNSKLWAATLCWFALMAGAQGLLYWLPQAIRHLSGGSSDFEVGVLSALPWFAIGVGMLVNAWHSDRTQERHLHVGLATLAAGALLAVTTLPAGAAALALLIVSGFFLGGAQSTFWTIPPTFLTPLNLAAGLGIINMCGNVAGLIVPAAVGWIRVRSDSFNVPIYAIAAVLVVGAAAILWLRSRTESSSTVHVGQPQARTP